MPLRFPEPANEAYRYQLIIKQILESSIHSGATRRSSTRIKSACPTPTSRLRSGSR
jgi:hypothetical protein